MERILSSPWFLGSTAACCGAAVALAAWATGGSGGDARALASLIALAAALGVMLLIAFAVATEEEPAAVVDRVPADPAPTPAPPSAPPPARIAPVVPDARGALVRLLDEGRALRAELGDAPDPRVASFVDRARQAIENVRPGLLGYFDALAGRSYATDADRLDAHLGRLATIARDFV